jgi:hypothetical protein
MMDKSLSFCLTPMASNGFVPTGMLMVLQVELAAEMAAIVSIRITAPSSGIKSYAITQLFIVRNLLLSGFGPTMPTL